MFYKTLNNFVLQDIDNFVLQEAISAYTDEAYTTARKLSGTGIVGTNPNINTNTETFVGQVRWFKPLNPSINIASLTDSSAGTKTSYTSDFVNYIKTVRTHGAEKVNMQQIVTQQDGLAKIGRDFAETRAQDEHNGLLAVLKGVAISEAINGAAAGSGFAKSLGATLSANGGKTVNPNPTSTGGPVSIGVKMAAGLVGGILGAGAGAAAGVAASAIAGEQRLVIGSDEIVLYIPDKLSTGYNANYETADLGALIGGLASGKTSVGGLFTEGTETADYLIRKAGRVANIAGFDQFTNVLQATSKRVENPYKEQLFKSMGFRQFSFSYTFSPRNLAEQTQVETLIRKFRLHMHPAKAPGDLFLIYPANCFALLVGEQCVIFILL